MHNKQKNIFSDRIRITDFCRKCPNGRLSRFNHVICLRVTTFNRDSRPEGCDLEFEHIIHNQENHEYTNL